MLQVFSYRLIDKSDFDKFYQSIKSKLPQTLLSKIETFRFASDKQRSLIADLIVRRFYAKELKIDPFQLEFDYNDHEKPSLKNYPKAHFNISHSGDYVVVAFSDCPVGIDIEKNKGNRLNVAKRFFTREELDDLFAFQEEDQIEYFYQLWTLKESYMKAIGKGISMSLNSFSFKKFYSDFRLRYSIEDMGFQFTTYNVHPEYACNLCSKYILKPKMEEIKISDFDEMK
ncbi:MAG: 4'-phosphopantetheinyl transferase superfamily protein [Bacteroidales bacterium]|jgi:4'-phosphopantetheinyl transferase|nr:4'-phosphopantetheinyl transferase superfamily protein [Bacteroidales bacterium]